MATEEKPADYAAEVPGAQPGGLMGRCGRAFEFPDALRRLLTSVKVVTPCGWRATLRRGRGKPNVTDATERVPPNHVRRPGFTTYAKVSNSRGRQPADALIPNPQLLIPHVVYTTAFAPRLAMRRKAGFSLDRLNRPGPSGDLFIVG